MSQTAVTNPNLGKISDGFIIRRFMVACIASKMSHNASSHQALQRPRLKIYLLTAQLWVYHNAACAMVGEKWRFRRSATGRRILAPLQSTSPQASFSCGYRKAPREVHPRHGVPSGYR
jgi:hypothetical protein